MSFLDRIRNNDDQEVELNPSNVHDGGTRRERQESGEVELQDDGDQDSSSGKGFLPGMGDQSGSTASAGSSRSAGKTDRLEKIMEQNERIIELLEEIAGSNKRSSSGNSSEELW